MSRNWILGLCAATLWVIPFALAFWGDVQRLWRERNDKWFRGDS